MTFLLDTNTCIQFLNGRSPSIRSRLTQLQSDEIALCSVVKAELIFGAIKSGRSNENISKLQHFASRFHSFPFDDQAAEKYGVVRSRLEKSGRPIGPNDLLIAAIALANKLTLVTHNIREFERVEGLIIEDWETGLPFEK